VVVGATERRVFGNRQRVEIDGFQSLALVQARVLTPRDREQPGAHGCVLREGVERSPGP
jgi:hypothetical protein